MKSLARRARSKSPFRRRRDALELLDDVRRYEQDFLSTRNVVPSTPTSSSSSSRVMIKFNSPPRLSLRNSPFRCSKKILDDEYHDHIKNHNHTDLDSTFTNSSCFGETREDEDDSYSQQKPKLTSDDGDRVEVRFHDGKRGPFRGRSHSPFRRRKTVQELIAEATKVEYIPSAPKSRGDPPSTPSTPSTPSSRSIMRSLSPFRSRKKSKAATVVAMTNNNVKPMDPNCSPSSALNISTDSDLPASSSPCTTHATTEGHSTRNSRLPPRPTTSALQSASVAPMLSVKLRPRRRKILKHLSVGYTPRNNNNLSPNGGDVSVVEVVLGSPSPSVCNLDESTDVDDSESCDAKGLSNQKSLEMQKHLSFRNRFLKAPSSIRQQSFLRQPTDPEAMVQSKIKQMASSKIQNSKKKKSSKCIVEFDLEGKRMGDVETIDNPGTKTPYSIKINNTRRSHVSELSSPDILPRKQSLAEESVAELRTALLKVQQEIEGKRATRDVVVSTLQNLAETLGNSHDRELMKQELDRITSGADPDHCTDVNESPHSSIMDRRKETARLRREAAKYFEKYGLDNELCGALTDEDDYTDEDYGSEDETGDDSEGSFSQWYDEMDQKQSGKFNLLDMLGLSRFLFADEDIEDDISGDETLPTPPRIKRQKDPEKTQSPNEMKKKAPTTAESPGRIQRREIRRQEIAAEEKMLRELEEEDRKIRQAQNAERVKSSTTLQESLEKYDEEDSPKQNRKQVEFAQTEEIICRHEITGTESEQKRREKNEDNEKHYRSSDVLEQQLPNSEISHHNLRDKGKEIRRLRQIEARKRLKAKGIERNAIQSNHERKYTENMKNASESINGLSSSQAQVKVDDGEAFGKIIEEELQRQREAEKRFRELRQRHSAAYQTRQSEEKKSIVSNEARRKKDPEGRKVSSSLDSTVKNPITDTIQETARTRSRWHRQLQNEILSSRAVYHPTMNPPSKTKNPRAISQELKNDEFSVGSIESQHFNQGLNAQVRFSDKVHIEERNSNKKLSKEHFKKTTIEMPASPPKVLYKYTIKDEEIPYVHRGRPDPSARKSKARSKRL